MRSYIVRYTFALVASLAATAGAQQRITFSDAVSIALRQNSSLKQAENVAASSSATVASKKNAFLPSLSLSTSGGEAIGRNFNTSEGAIVNQSTQSLNASLSSSITVFDGLRNVRELKQAQLNSSASTSDLARARQTTVFTVTSDFLALTTARAQLAVQRQNLATQEAQEAQLQKLVNAGSRPVSELYQQQATTATSRSTVLTAEHQVALAEVELIQTLQLDPRATYEFESPATAGIDGAKAFSLDSLLDRAFAMRTDLGAEESRVAAAAQGTRAAKASLLPTVSVSAGYNTAYSSATSLSLADQLNQRRGGSVSVGVSVPLFDRGAASVAEQQAKIQEDNARLALANQKQAIALEVRRAYLEHASTRQQLVAALAAQKAADLAVSTTQQRYQLGSSTLLELTQARASQVAAATAVANAQNALGFQEQMMAYYTGDLRVAE